MCISEIKKCPIIFRTLKVASCSRTCKDNLELYFQRYITSLELNNEEQEIRLVKIKNMLVDLEL